jgi:hypothetical protein
MSRRFEPSRPLARRAPTLSIPPAMLVFCEGKTEQRLLSELRGCWRVAAARVIVTGEEGVPSTLVGRARDARESHRRAFGSTDDPAIWVVFDRDDHKCWERAIRMARDLGFSLAISNPCFEIWGLLLYQDQTAYIERKVLHRKFARLHPGYDHKKNPYLCCTTVLAKIDAAKDRADRLQREASHHGKPRRNPWTSFHELVEALRQMKVG